MLASIIRRGPLLWATSCSSNYNQSSVSSCANHKLAFRFHGHFQCWRVGEVEFRLSFVGEKLDPSRCAHLIVEEGLAQN